MTNPTTLLPSLPDGLRKPLMHEFRHIIQNYMERRWSPAELSGGRFSEIVFTILDGYARSSYPAGPAKPRDLVSACRSLEANAHVPRSFQILIPRMLPALYEIRNNRGVGHVGGDVDPNHMDANAVLAMAAWIMAELVRVLHGIDVSEAQRIVDSIAERRIPLVWLGNGVKRVLDPKLPLKEQVLLLLASEPDPVPLKALSDWCGCKNMTYFRKLLRKMHKERLIEFSADDSVQILPPGTSRVERHASKAGAV